MTSREYFEAFCRALENAQEPQSKTSKQSNDRDIFWRVREILSVCYEGLTDRRLCYAIQRRACDIMLGRPSHVERYSTPEIHPVEIWYYSGNPKLGPLSLLSARVLHQMAVAALSRRTSSG